MKEPSPFQELLEGFNHPLKAVLLFGPPGSGKGTLGKFLSLAGGHYHLSSGDVFRGLSPHSPAGQLYQQYALKGLLVPDEATVAIWHNYVEGLIATNRLFPESQLLLLDGLPRTAKQIKLVEKHLNILKIISLEVPDENKLIQRLKKRALIEKRKDDAEEAVLFKRMEVYKKETLEILNYFPASLISRFNADQKPLEVLRDVLVDLPHLF